MENEDRKSGDGYICSPIGISWQRRRLKKGELSSAAAAPDLVVSGQSLKAFCCAEKLIFSFAAPLVRELVERCLVLRVATK